MSTQDRLAAIDGMIVDYLVQAMAGDYDPANDPDRLLAPEREAVFRLFLYEDMTVTPTVLNQLSATKDTTWRDRLQRLVLVHLQEAHLAAPPHVIASRTQELLSFHSDELDCRIVAEAESIPATALLSFDRRLRRRLAMRTTLLLLTPSEYWAQRSIPRGSPPRWVPAPGNPLANKTWWSW